MYTHVSVLTQKRILDFVNEWHLVTSLLVAWKEHIEPFRKSCSDFFARGNLTFSFFFSFIGIENHNKKEALAKVQARARLPAPRLLGAPRR